MQRLDCHVAVCISKGADWILLGFSGPLQNTTTWYKIQQAGTPTAHRDIQNKEDLSLSDLSRLVLNVPVRSLRSSMVDCVPCDRILQRAYYEVCGAERFTSVSYCRYGY